MWDGSKKLKNVFLGSLQVWSCVAECCFGISQLKCILDPSYCLSSVYLMSKKLTIVIQHPNHGLSSHGIPPHGPILPYLTRCVNPGVFLKVNSTLGGQGAPYFAWLHIGPRQARTKGEKKNLCPNLQCAPFTPEKTVQNYRYLASLNLIFHFVPKQVDL